jgi:myo-inositol-1(or 4)-monophosphatase
VVSLFLLKGSKLYSEKLEQVISIAKKAGSILTKYYLSEVNPERKSDQSFVSKVDRESQAYIESELKKHFPDYHFLGEETFSNQEIKESPTWVVDPLDGTNNFLLGIPHFCISIGLIENNESNLGVVFNPITEELFCAEKNHGAYYNDKRLMAKPLVVKSAIIGRYFSDTMDAVNTDSKLVELQNFFRDFDVVRSLGAAALDMAYFASGKANFYWQRGLQIWDIGASICLLNELGHSVKNESGKNFDLSKDKAVVIGDEKSLNSFFDIIK